MKTKFITLVLITAALASCHKKQPKRDWNEKTVYMRSDESADYDRQNSNFWLWYYAFRPYGYYNNGVYSRAGYYSSGIRESSNIGSSSFKGNVVRGGFGGGGYSVSA
jgi:hypothetical protein